MKKFFIVALILALAVGTAYAADETFKVGGQYRMEMYNIDDADYNSDVDDQQQYVDQRFRVKADFMPADGVKAIWQADFAETQWGSRENADGDEVGIAYRPGPGHSTIMVDKAYVDLTKEMFNIKAGLFGTAGLGMGITTDDQGPQIIVTANFEPVTVTGMWRKESEGTALTDDADQENDLDGDTDTMGAEVKFATEAFSAGLLYATQPNKATDAEKNVIGVFGSTSFGKVNLWGEVDSFSGDDGGDVDYVGMNVTLSASMAVTEQLGIFVDLGYAPGTDADDEEQITYLTDDAAYMPIDQGPFAWIWAGTGLDLNQVDYNTGATSVVVRAEYAVMDNLNLMGLIAYMMPSEEDPDGDDNYIDNQTVLTLGATYTFLPKTSFSLQYTTSSRSVTNDGPAATEISDDPLQMMGGLLKVNF